MKKLLLKNKALFILPLALLPFVVLIFWVLGGGTAVTDEKTKEQLNEHEGANYLLPEAEKSIEIYDKMEAYQRDEQLSAEIQSTDAPDSLHSALRISSDSVVSDITLLDRHTDPEALLSHIRDKEKQVQQELQVEPPVERKPSGIQSKNISYSSKNVQEKPEKSVKKAEPGTGIEELDKIIDHNIELNRKNDSLKFSLQEVQGKLQQIEAAQNRSFTLEKKQSSGFNRETNQESSLIKAEIYETTTVLNGNRVKMRLLESTRVNGREIPQNTFVYGTCKIKNERLHIEITQLPVQQSFVPVKLNICDLDGMEGLYVPDNAARKVYREVGASTNTSSMMGVTNNPLSYAGIRAADRAAQTMLKRVRLKKVTVKKNTLVYIINQK